MKECRWCLNMWVLMGTTAPEAHFLWVAEEIFFGPILKLL